MYMTVPKKNLLREWQKIFASQNAFIFIFVPTVLKAGMELEPAYFEAMRKRLAPTPVDEVDAGTDEF